MMRYRALLSEILRSLEKRRAEACSRFGLLDDSIPMYRGAGVRFSLSVRSYLGHVPQIRLIFRGRRVTSLRCLARQNSWTRLTNVTRAS